MFVTLIDAAGAEHVVPVPDGLTPEYALQLAASKLHGWAEEGRAVFTPPLREKGPEDE